MALDVFNVVGFCVFSFSGNQNRFNIFIIFSVFAFCIFPGLLNALVWSHITST